MADETGDKTLGDAHKEGGAAKRPDVGDAKQERSGKTESGQEAYRVPPGSHDREHQSNYGGGGENGGANGGAKQ